MTKDEILNMPAGREMDALIASIFFKDSYIHSVDSTNGLQRTFPFFSKDISAAWEVVEKLKKDGWSFTLTQHADPLGDYVIEFWRRDNFMEDYDTIRENTAPLAICRAALLAHLEETK